MEIINTFKNIDLSNENEICKYWNSNDLKELYFEPKKVNIGKMDSILSDDLYKDRLKKTIDFLNKNDVENLISELIKDFESDTGKNVDSEKIYVIVGFNTTTIYSVNAFGEDVTALCLEAINGDFDKLKMLIAHEFTHFVRKKLLNKDIFNESIGERMVTEGIASNYSREMVLGKEASEYCIVSEDTINWVKENMDFLENYTKGKLESNELMSDLFYMFAEIDFPVRTGYVYGYFKVKEYLDKNNLKIKDILQIDWHEIL